MINQKPKVREAKSKASRGSGGNGRRGVLGPGQARVLCVRHLAGAIRYQAPGGVRIFIRSVYGGALESRSF
jgi:hypothetical protein